jgi:hypothetical protein
MDHDPPMKVTTALNSFTGGELSPRLDGRPDLKKFSQGARVLENMIVMPHGGIKKRSGTKFIVNQYVDSPDVALVPFQYSTEQSYIILFGHNYCWFFKDQGLITHTGISITAAVQADSVVTITAAGHTFSPGDTIYITGVLGMTEINNRVHVVDSVSGNNITLQDAQATVFTAYASGGTVAEVVVLATTYTSTEVQELQFAQSADTLFISHKNHPMRKLQRYSHTSWALSVPSITTGPFRTVNGTREYKLTCSFPGANITGATKANPCVITAVGHPFTESRYVLFDSVGGMTELNGNTYVVTNVTADTFELSGVNSTGYGTYTSGGVAVTAPTAFGTYVVGQAVTLTATGGHTPFTAGMVGALIRLSEEGASSGYMAAPLADQTKSLTNGQQYTNNGKVYGVANVGASTDWGPVNRVPSHDSGIIRIIGASGTLFDSNYLHPTYSVVQITEYVSTTVVKCVIVRYQLPKTIAESGTSFWEEGAWSARRGYPRAIAFYEQRLFLGGSDSDPTVVWSSRSGEYENFEDGPDDSNALVYRVPGRSADVIRWLSSGRVLTAGSSFGEFAFASSSQNQALTPSNVKASPQTSYGTSNCLPVQINQAVLYPQRNGNPDNAARKLREFAYRYDQDAFGSTDMTVFSEHVFGDGITKITYQTEPDSLIWCRRSDGTLACCTYERLQEVVAWHRHAIAGPDAVVKTLACIPGDDGDEVWMSVERTIADETIRYIEVLAPTFKDDDDKADARLLDCHLTYSGASTTTISGLWHIRGETVKVLNNGAIENAVVDANGRLTLAYATTKAHIGYGYTGIMESEDFEAGAQAGTAQSRAKRISQIYIRTLSSLGGTAGPDAGNQKLLLYRKPSQPMGSSPPLFSGMVELDFPGGWERFARVRIEHTDPLPFHVTALVAEMSTVG